jgi:hypothetical protein
MTMRRGRAILALVAIFVTILMWGFSSARPRIPMSPMRSPAVDDVK